MKILIVQSPAFDPQSGGVQRITYKIGKYFHEQGETVSYLCLAPEGHKEVEYGDLYYVPQKGEDHSKANQEYIKSALNTIQPDIVVNQMPYLVKLGEILHHCSKSQGFILVGCLNNSLYNFKSNARYVSKLMLPSFVFRLLDNPMGTWLIQKRHWLKHRKQLKTILDQNHYFVLPTPPNRKELEHFVGSYHSEKVLPIPNSIPFVGSEIPKKEKIVLYVGRLNDGQKRSDLLLPVWKNVYPHLPDWKFVIVGYGPYKQAIDDEIARLNLPRVETVGKQNPTSYYEESTIFIMPSSFEGFPSVLLEAQSNATIPVAFNSYAGIEYIINDEKDGCLVQPFDTKKMAEKIVALGSEPGKIQTMAGSALQNAARFTIDNVGRQWLDFFYRALKEVKQVR